MSSHGFSSIQSAVEEIRQGGTVIVCDNDDREAEGDLVMAAQFVAPEDINFMVTHGRGLVCLPMAPGMVERLQIPDMVECNGDQLGTAFTASIEAREGVTTGTSAADRARTIRVAVDPGSGAQDLVMPGHVFPLKSRDGGVLERAGHTEAAVDLARLAGLVPAGVICEVMNGDGSMARVSDLEQFADHHGLKMVSVSQLIEYRSRHVEKACSAGRCELPNRKTEQPATARR